MANFSIIVKGSRCFADRLGTKYSTVFHVSNLPPTNAFNLTVQGLQDTVSGQRIPVVGELSGNVIGSVILSVEATPLMPDCRTDAKVVVIAGPPELGSDPNIVIIRISDSVGQKIQQINADGTPQIIKYCTTANGPVAVDPSAPASSDPDFTGYDFVSTAMPGNNTIVEFEQTLNYCPLSRSRQFRRTVNLNPWNGFESGCVLFRGLSAQSINGGVQYRARTLFEAAPAVVNAAKYSNKLKGGPIGPWDVIEFYRDTLTHQIPREVIKSVQMFQNPLDGGFGALLVQLRRADFAQMQLPTIST